MTGRELPPDDRPPEGLRGTEGWRRGPGRARAGRRVVVVVAGLEAGLLALAAGAAVLSGLGDGSLPLALGVALAALVTAYLLVEVARGFARGRRWPTGIFVTVQLLVALTALSVGAPSLLSLLDSPRAGGLTLLALLVSGAGLLGVVLLWPSTDQPGEDDVPVL